MILGVIIVLVGFLVIFLSVLREIPWSAVFGAGIAFIGIASIGLSNKPVAKTPEEQYEKLLQDKEDANKALQKFFIDYPEFKESE